MSSPPLQQHNSILLVDDEMITLNTLRRLLERHGCLVNSTDSPVTALGLVQQNSYAVTIVDIGMPHISGFELLGQIQAENPDIRVILMSGHAEMDMVIKALKKGAFDFIPKPFDAKQVLETVDKAIEKFAHIQAAKESVAILEEKLFQSSQDWENTFNTLTDGITIHDMDFNIIFANRAAQDILQLPSPLPDKAKCFHYFHGTETPPPRCASCKSLKTGKQINVEIFEPHLDIYMELQAIPRFNQKNELIGLIHIIRDISVRKKAEKELKRMQTAALESSRIKSEFLANMSHEIRTPMNGVIGMLELLLNTEISQQQREYISMCKTSAQGMLSLLNEILEISKIESGKLDLEESEFSLRQTVKSSIDPLLLLLQEKGLSFQGTITDKVEDALIGDGGRLRQIIINLVGNAIKFTESGTISVTVSPVEQHKEQVTLHFTVRDTGIGIPPNRLETIFEAFRQVDSSTTRKYGGTGLGLSIAKNLVEMMSGHLWATSEIGKGSTFHFILPFRVGKAETIIRPDPLGSAWNGWAKEEASVEFDYPRNENEQAKKKGGSGPHVKEQLNKLEKALSLKNLMLIEEYAYKLKESASKANLASIADDAFRIQLAARKGDLDRCATVFTRLNKGWNKQRAEAVSP